MLPHSLTRRTFSNGNLITLDFLINSKIISHLMLVVFESFPTKRVDLKGLLSSCYFKVGFTWSERKFLSIGNSSILKIFQYFLPHTLSVLSIFSSLFSILAAEKLQFVILPPASYFFLKVNTMSCL